MRTVTIQVINVDVEDVPGKDYQKANVTYKTAEGKVEGRNIMSFVSESVWNSITKAQKGDWFDVEQEKDKTGKYWNWVGIHRQDSPPKQEAPVGKVNTFAEKNELDKQKFEYDKQKQQYIIRQSSLSNAVAYMAAYNKGTAFSPDDVINVARRFEAFVYHDGVDGLVDDSVD